MASKLILSSLLLVVSWTNALVLGSRDAVKCSFSTTADDGDTCETFSSEWGLTVDQFVAINPGVQCPDLVDGQLYCVVGTVATSTSAATSVSSTSSSSGKTTSSTAIPTTLSTSPSTTTSSSSTTVPPSTTSAQHQPQQPDLAADCNNFYQVASGDSCDSIEARYGITAADFNSWNPSINTDCTNLLAGYYVCVGVLGSKTAAPSTTTPANGIVTPTPTQPGMVNDCNKFDEVQSGDSCSAIADKYDISLSDFYDWNPAVGSDCHALWVGYYVCVDIEPSKTTPPAGNGIATPTPYEAGMVDNCGKFYKVQSGDTCDAIASSQGVSTSQIETWNPNVGSDCSHLYLGYYICVGVE